MTSTQVSVHYLFPATSVKKKKKVKKVSEEEVGVSDIKGWLNMSLCVPENRFTPQT